MNNEASQLMQLQRVRDLELAIQIEGKGRTFVWGHNLLGSMEADDTCQFLDWSRLADHNLIVRYDARGHGESQGSTNPEAYVWQNLGRDMLNIAQQFSAKDKVVLGGASMGCATALHAACEMPEKVAGLVLVLPPTGWKTRPKQSKRYERISRFSGTLSRVGYLLYDVLPFNRKPKDLKQALGSAVLQQLGHANKAYIKGALLGAAESDMPTMQKISKLDVPTLILTWCDDDSHPVSSAEMLDDLLPNVHACHITSVKEAENWTSYIEDFLRTL